MTSNYGNKTKKFIKPIFTKVGRNLVLDAVIPLQQTQLAAQARNKVGNIQL